MVTSGPGSALALRVEGSLRVVERLLVYHNPSCSKSRGALKILADQDGDHDVVEYLTAPPDRASLPELMQRPVIVRGERAVIARPSEKVLELLD
jgi:arsenate reductase (glutaredoxin)